MSDSFEPRIIGFMCNWCAYECADSLGRSRSVYPSGFYIVRLMCAGRFEPVFALEAFQKGADGVAVMGCHLGECHYQSGNLHALKRFVLMRKTLEAFGIQCARFRMEWIAACDKLQLIQVIHEMYQEILTLGPLTMP